MGGIPQQTLDLDRMIYPSKVLLTSEKVMYTSKLLADQIVFNEIKNECTDYAISRISIKNKKFFVLHYIFKKSCHFIYYDDQLNFVKQTEYPFGFWISDMTQIHLLSENQFVCVINKRLNIVDIKTRQMRQPIYDATGWHFKIDENKKHYICI